MAIEAQGSKLFWSASTAASTAVQVGGFMGFNGPSGSAAVIDITTLGSTAKEKLMGLPDEGQLSADLLYISTDAGQIALIADRASRSKRKATLKLTDSSTQALIFDAFVTNFSITGAVDDAVKAAMTMEITGPVNFSTA